MTREKNRPKSLGRIIDDVGHQKMLWLSRWLSSMDSLHDAMHDRLAEESEIHTDEIMEAVKIANKVAQAEKLLIEAYNARRGYEAIELPGPVSVDQVNAYMEEFWAS